MNIAVPMLVSVVIVTRNRCRLVLDCLESVLAQDYPAIEILVVDNASTDGTCAAVAEAYPQVRLLRQERNTGAPGGRNIGIGAASGAICVSIDDDAVFLDRSSISRCVPYFTRDPKLGCLALRIVDQYGNIVTKLIPRRDRRIITADAAGANFSGTGFVLRRDVFVALGGFWEKLNPYFGEEPDFTCRLLDGGYHILHTPFISIRHYETPNERPRERRMYFGTRNAPWIALRSFPWPAVISLTVLAWGYFFLIAGRDGQLRSYGRAIADSLRGLPEVYRMRRPISRETARILRKHSGLLFY